MILQSPNQTAQKAGSRAVPEGALNSEPNESLNHVSQTVAEAKALTSARA